MKALVTGATGFVGLALVRKLAGDSAFDVIGCSRCPDVSLVPSISWRVAPDLDQSVDWREALVDVDVVVHCAARVHAMNEKAADPLSEFQRVNVDGTLSLARQAAESGVRRLVFISSIKVNGEHTDDRPPFTPDDVPAPEDAYGVSKQEAETGLREIAAETGMEVVIIRPPVVYGPGVKGNFRSLLKLASLPAPLPLGDINNRRSLVYLGNLVDFIIHAAQHPLATNRTFLVSDGLDLSTTALISQMRRAMGHHRWLLPVPGRWLRGAARLAGNDGVGRRLCGSLQLDTSLNESLLGWRPPYKVEQGIANTVSALQSDAGN